MTTVTQLPQRQGTVPPDTFPIRLAIVRAMMGWNYDQAARETGLNSETWRLWEKRKRRCNDIEAVSRRVAAVTGISYKWLMVGGPLGAPDPSDPTVRTGWSRRPFRLSMVAPVSCELWPAA